MTAKERLDLARRATEELRKKSLREINEDTAWLWASRAWAAYNFAKESPRESQRWLKDATEYEHEAVEHAAVSEKIDTLVSIRAFIDTQKPKDSTGT